MLVGAVVGLESLDVEVGFDIRSKQSRVGCSTCRRAGKKKYLTGAQLLGM